MISKYVWFPLLLLPAFAWGGSSEGGEHSATLFLLIGFILFLAKLSSIIEKLHLPSVLGELLIGILLGNLALLFVGSSSVPEFLQPITMLPKDEIFIFLAELGVIFLMLQVGLESNIREMQADLGSSLLVASVGVVLPFAFGYLLSQFLLPDLEQLAHIFIGATLTATSVGITARIFRDANLHKSQAGRIVLGAAVADDIIGLLILAAVSAIAAYGVVNGFEILSVTLKAFAFMLGAFLLGGHLKFPQSLASKVSIFGSVNNLISNYNLAALFSKLFAKIDPKTGTKLTFVLIVGFVSAYLAKLVGMEPIIGAFAAGLILEHAHFNRFNKPDIVKSIHGSTLNIRKELHGADPQLQENIGMELKRHDEHIKEYEEQHVDELVAPIGHFLVPLFFVYVGMQVDLSTLGDLSLVGTALLITIVAILGKWASGLVVPRGSRNLVGFGMVPRGEVGLIFALVGQRLEIINDQVFSIMVLVVVFTTLITPPVLSYLIHKQRKEENK